MTSAMEYHVSRFKWYLQLLTYLLLETSIVSEQTQTVQDEIFTLPYITTAQHHHRLRRDNSECQQNLEIVLPLADKDLVLLLTQSSLLLAPNAVFEMQNGEITTASTVGQNCYYQGKLKEADNSYAAISVSDGLLGMFEYNGTHYSIEPVLFDDMPFTTSDKQLHTIKKIANTGFEGIIDDNFLLSDITNKKWRRAANEDKFLEVMIVLDNTVINFHGEERTELFILALFNMINLIYGHSSLGISIKLSLVKIVLLDDEAMKEFWEGDDPRTTLDRFCVWSAANSLRDHEPGHYDFSMYLSRDKMAPAGYAPVTGMCRPDRSCALIKEDGFSTSFVAAHEIGHTIGMTHDGEGTNKCVNEPNRGSIMAPLVMANLNNFFWSPCSKDEIDEIVSSLYCLNDDPFESEWSEILVPLGRNWALDEQCRKDFGEGYRLCSRLTHNFNPCEHLWCSTPENRYLCKTKKAPPLPGSECAEGRWCLNSQCVVANPDDPIWSNINHDYNRIRAVDGAWSTWSSWSKCSTSCGKGIKSRTRSCTNPEPALGGRNCQGEDYELRLCDLPEQMRLVCKMYSTLSFSVRRSCMKHKVYYMNCDREVDDIRADQCTRYNKPGRTYLPYQPEHKDQFCLLNCQTKEQAIPLYGEIEAMDGTFCSYDDRYDMCYAGHCIPMGCDGKFGSELKEDKCGVCQGDNSNCTIRNNYYNERLERGYQLLVRLYPGTRHFRIKKPDDAYKLVLVNTKTNETILTENHEAPYTVVDHGTLWRYKSDRSQTLETSGPLQAEYDVIIFSKYRGLRATLSISFTEPLEIIRSADRKKKVMKRYQWMRTGWTKCSERCGTGWQEEIYHCMSMRLNRTVTDLLCQHDSKPKIEKRVCKIQECNVVYRWVTSDWTKCPDYICKISEFKQRRWAFCVKEDKSLGTRWRRVDSSLCQKNKKPPLMQLCDKTRCKVEGYWKTGQWSKCSVTCGVGVQRRNVSCVPKDLSKRGAAKCDTEPPSLEEYCGNAPCNEVTTIISSTITDYSITEPNFSPKNLNRATVLSILDSESTLKSSNIKHITSIDNIQDISGEGDSPISSFSSDNQHTEILLSNLQDVTTTYWLTSNTKSTDNQNSFSTPMADKHTTSSIPGVTDKQEETTTHTISKTSTLLSTKDEGSSQSTTPVQNSTSTAAVRSSTSTATKLDTVTLSSQIKWPSVSTPTSPTQRLITTTLPEQASQDITLHFTGKLGITTAYQTEMESTKTVEPVVLNSSDDITMLHKTDINEYEIKSYQGTTTPGYTQPETTTSRYKDSFKTASTTKAITSLSSLPAVLSTTKASELTSLHGWITKPLENATGQTTSKKYLWWQTTTSSPTESTETPQTTYLTTRFIWWWTSTTTPSYCANTSKIQTSTPRSSTPKLSTPRSEVASTTKSSISNTIEDNNVDDKIKESGSECDTDLSGICELMNSGKCQLLLFKKLCCHTCNSILN